MIRNIRDLGGLTGDGGRKIKKNMLIRSAMLNNIDDEDIAWMRSINLTKVYDLRTESEVERKPDIKVPGVENVNFILQDGSDRIGLTMKGIRALMISAKTDEERIALVPSMNSLYSSMVENEFSKMRMGQLIKEIVNYDNGAILFHCTSGKDRTGMVAAILCTILGVSREDIFDDYLRSLEHAEWESAIMKEEFIDEGASEAVADKLKQFFMIDREYLETFFNTIEKNSGSVEAYVKEVYGIDDAMISKFKERMLEE